MYEICLGPQTMIPRGIDGPPLQFTQPKQRGTDRGHTQSYFIRVQ